MIRRSHATRLGYEPESDIHHQLFRSTDGCIEAPSGYIVFLGPNPRIPAAERMPMSKQSLKELTPNTPPLMGWGNCDLIDPKLWQLIGWT
ncbi:MAG TPA: hypothetical protein VHK27_13695 [Gammaproteobacteria bacterium]|nr:hypothetical protein [Gammaproteobacteria bacterium]